MSVPYEVEQRIRSANYHVEDAIRDLEEVVDLPRSGFQDPERILRDLKDISHRLRHF